MTRRLSCLVGRHRWHNGWDEDRHQAVWTCNRCGKTRSPNRTRYLGTGGGGVV